jgi:hypothetical protein
MAIFLVAGLALGLLATPLAEPEHIVRIDHASGPIEAQYRPSLRIATRQVGTATAPGKPDTLACAWRADLIVDRQARSATGSSLRRAIDREGIAEGRRAGWCSTQRAAIEREAARRAGELRRHTVEVAQEDHAVIHGELDAAHRETNG